MPRTTNSLGAESMTPEGDMERGMCSMEKRVGTTGTDRPTRRNPREPCREDHNLGCYLFIFSCLFTFVYLERPALSGEDARLDGGAGVVGVAPDGDPEQGPRGAPGVEGLSASEVRGLILLNVAQSITQPWHKMFARLYKCDLLAGTGDPSGW